MVESPGGGTLISASRFEATGLGTSAEEAAREFLKRYGASFGVLPSQELVISAPPGQGPLRSVRFERRMDKLPVFDGGGVVGVDEENTVILVNASDLPPEVSGRFLVSKRAAVKMAKISLGKRVHLVQKPVAVRGWRAAGRQTRAAWRVDFVANQPAGEWRVFVDADNGAILFKINRRLRSTFHGGVRR